VNTASSEMQGGFLVSCTTTAVTSSGSESKWVSCSGLRPDRNPVRA